MIKEFTTSIMEFMACPNNEKLDKIKDLYSEIMADEVITEEDKNSAKTVFSYVEWVACA